MCVDVEGPVGEDLGVASAAPKPAGAEESIGCAVAFTADGHMGVQH